MSKNLSYIRGLLQRHSDEAADGLVDKPPSQLLRGEGTEKNFYIMKIDLVGSTQLLWGRKKSTYLKLAHTFLSTIDKITQDFGADAEQVEYAGDSVLAYFAENRTKAEDVLWAACYSRVAVQQIHTLEGVLNTLQLKCKIVLHYDALMVSKIGPRANSILTAIGHPIHRVAKLEKELSPDSGWATEKFFQQIKTENRKFFSPQYTEKQIPVLTPHHPSPYSLTSLPNLGAHRNSLAEILYGSTQTFSQASTVPKYEIEKTLVGYNLRWPILYRELELT